MVIETCSQCRKYIGDMVDGRCQRCVAGLPELKPPGQENILQEADRLTGGDRRKEYGHPSIQFDRLAKLWSIVLGVEVTPMEVALCLIQLKVSRQMNGHHRDSLVDIAGYARVAEMLTEVE